MRLSKKLNLSFTALILISIIVISFISNIMINNRFENYLIKEREDKFQRIFEEINNLYINNNFQLDPMELKHYALAEDINIIIKTLDGKIQYNSNTRARMSNPMMKGMHRRGMGRMMEIPEGNYVEKTYILSHENEDFGYLVLGYIDNAYLTESAIIFKNTLYESFIISGIITISIGLIVSIILSRRLTNPLINIRNTANEIQSGNLSAYSKVDTDVKEILELSQSLNFLGSTLAHQEDIRKRYASDISHELRTPLTTLKSHLEAIIDGVWEPTEDHLQILMSEITRLSNLVDDLKDSFSAEEYNINLNKIKFNISQEMENIITTFTPIYNQKNHSIKYSIEKDIEVLMDKDKFKQIINNLLSNSLRYLEDNGEVFVELKKVEDNLIITVEDNGIGIKKEDLPFIFHRFYRVDNSRDKATGGTGLGLSIVKSMVEAHGGKIDIESEYKKGTKAILQFPIL